MSAKSHVRAEVPCPESASADTRSILYLEPVYHSYFSDHFRRLAANLVAPSTRVVVESLGGGRSREEFDLFAATDAQCVTGVVGKAEEARARGFDAIVVGCASDPGIDALQRRLQLPIVGAFRAALSVATLHARRIAVVTPEPKEEIARLRALAREYGYDRLVHSIRAVHVGHPQVEEVRAMGEAQRASCAEEVLAAHRAAVDVEGTAWVAIREAIETEDADGVVLACTLWSGMLQPLRSAFSVPIIDCASAALRAAEALVH